MTLPGLGLKEALTTQSPALAATGKLASTPGQDKRPPGGTPGTTFHLRRRPCRSQLDPALDRSTPASPPPIPTTSSTTEPNLSDPPPSPNARGPPPRARRPQLTTSCPPSSPLNHTSVQLRDRGPHPLPSRSSAIALVVLVRLEVGVFVQPELDVLRKVTGLLHFIVVKV